MISYIKDGEKREGLSIASECVSNLSKDKKLNKLLTTVVTEVKRYAEEQIQHIKKRAEIGLALSAEHDIDKLLEMIVDEARALCRADAGTLYIVNDEGQNLCFKILQNDSMKTRLSSEINGSGALPKVPLYIDGEPNYSNVSSYVALTGEIVNVPDVYEAEGFDFTGPRKYDAATGYRSKSMLVIPLRNHEDEIIGVLQLLNALNSETREVIPFFPEYVDLVGSLASQAAVALTNVQLIEELRNLLYAFIKSIATAIDEKSPWSGGHINRVVELAMLIAHAINETDDGPYKDIRFTEDEIEELKMAAWMHDVGKITTPEFVLDKRTKLHTLFDRIELIEKRFHVMKLIIENRYLQKKNDLFQSGAADASAIRRLDQAMDEELKSLSADFEFIRSCNNTGDYMADESVERIKRLAQKKMPSPTGDIPYLTEDEVRNLTVRKGTLTREERAVIENHVSMTMKMLSQLPFPKRLAKVPEYAAGHHEKIDGSGYPLGLKGDQLPLQARILAVADVFEALTAKDRPYKEPMKISTAIQILGKMKDQQHIDPNIYDLFLKTRLYLEYARKRLNPEQIDES